MAHVYAVESAENLSDSPSDFLLEHAHSVHTRISDEALGKRSNIINRKEDIMGKKEELIEDILQREWKMFQAVKNVGARATCQDDYNTFSIMRSSQATSWSEETLASYKQDLIEAEIAGRNLLSEKYGHMMESTSPAEYAKIASLLPTIDSEALTLIEQIVPIVMEWEVELEKKYSYIIARGRPLFRKEDSPGVTSLETYLTGELKSYSTRTLKRYLAHVQKMRQDNINGSEIIMLASMKQYGFNSLEEANDKIKARSEGR